MTGAASQQDPVVMHDETGLVAASRRFADTFGEHLEGDKKIVSRGVVIAGRWWHPR